ncbi:MAG: hypothetical protein VR65_14155 [Desulfobulbaceae bacterium BRH_c16a]|nr:MAG: hypothetical protein VR65_14155 [Desulfobulbaceae bacterium BRH_c16a]
MDGIKAVSRIILVRVLTVMLLICLVIDAGSYWLLQTLSEKTGRLAEAYPSLPEITAAAARVQAAENGFWLYFVPASIIFFLLVGLSLWLFLRRPVARHMQERAAARPQKVEQRQPLRQEGKEEAEVDKRIFVHLLSALQREGRLMDFLAENLAGYQDAQIGVAVRNIHENCKKTLDKYLVPQAVLEQQEGDEITLERDFDPGAVKLIGNVTGQPPFKGTVRHRGWRAGKLDLPTFSGHQDPAIIAPAEVEVG